MQQSELRQKGSPALMQQSRSGTSCATPCQSSPDKSATPCQSSQDKSTATLIYPAQLCRSNNWDVQHSKRVGGWQRAVRDLQPAGLGPDSELELC
eukprot:352886-Chlamydomonas_euryale.AAC.3